MVICQSLALAALIVWFGRDFIRKRPALCYAVAAALALASVAGLWSGVIGELPGWFARWVIPMFTRGALALALFFFVMFANAVPNGSPFMKRVMPIRGELSIIASILAIGHGAALGKAQLEHALAGRLDGALGAAAFIVSLLLMAVMLPLFVTSFRRIRRKMKPRAWKKLQRAAYAFYALACLHIILFNIKGARGGNAGALINVLVYGGLFVTYAVMRGRKALEKKYPNRSNPREALAALGAAVMAALALLAMAPAPALPVEPLEETALAEAEPDSTPEPAPLPASLPAYADGEYTGRGMGYNGQMKAAVTIENGVIVDIRIKSVVDDQEYVDKIQATLIPAMLAAQSAQVDAVSGATSSSDGLMAAVGEALEKAAGN